MPHDTSQPAQLNSLWWLRPAWLFSLISLGTASWAVSMSPASYALYDVPKYVDGDYLLLSVLAVAAFLVGCNVASRFGSHSIPLPLANYSPSLFSAFYLATTLCLAGYLVWLAVGVTNGFRPGMIWMFLRAPDDVTSHDLKEQIFPTIPGVTTCTQFGIVTVILGFLPPLWRERKVRAFVFLVLGLGMFRAMFLSERLAFVELVVCGGISALRSWILGKPWKSSYQTAFRFAPIVGPLALLVFFGTAEYFRSWQFYQNRFDNIVDFTLWRVSAYYTLCHNNTALLLEKQGSWPLPYSMLSALWSFPLIERSSLSYDSLTGLAMPGAFHSLYDRFGNREYNNEGGLLAPLVDGGYFTLITFWMCLGYLSERAYRSYMAGSIGGLAFFPILFLSLLETPRFLYLGTSRATPPLVFFAGLLVYLSYTVPRTATRHTPSLSLAGGGEG